LKKGCVQVYTGNGKGKTTAALGLSLRAAGAGLKVLFVQFLKGRNASEHESLRLLAPQIELRRFGGPGFIMEKPSQEDIAAAREGLEAVREAVRSGAWDVMVLDEINVAVSLGLILEADVLDLLDERPEGMEMVLTGRNAPEGILQKADLVTEMKEIRHYWRKGIPARRGIED